MSNRLHHLILALAASGVTAAAWAQNAPDSGPGGPGGQGGPPPHAWHGGDDGAHRAHKWDHEDGRDGEHRHHHHHHHHHQHHHGQHGGGGWGAGEHGDHEGGGGPGEWHHRGGMGGPGMVYRDLKLTPEQHQKMRVIVMQAKLQMMQQAGTHKPEDRTVLMNPGDPNYKAAVQAAKQRAADRIQRMSDLKLQLYNVLTPEQKTELTKKISDWKARMAQRGDGAKGPPGPAAR